jgi:hypothetical protein
MAVNIYLYIIYDCYYIFTSMWNYLLMRDKGIIDVKSNSRNLYSRCQGCLCWNTAEEQVEIDSIGMFIMYVHV